MMRRLLFLLSVTALDLMGSAAVGAVVVNIDFQAGTGRGVMSGNAGTVLFSEGAYWNTNGPNGVPQTLLTSTGAPSGYALLADLYPAGTTSDADALFGDYVVGDATIMGLNPGQEYQLVIYGGANIQNIYRVDQPFDQFSPAYGEVTCSYHHTVLPGVEGCDYVVGEVVADALGQVTVRVHPGALAGLQLAHNPEPSVGFLQAAAGVLLLLRRRRSKG